MGKSITIHCIGYGPNINQTWKTYHAMNRREIAQEIEKARKAGETIVHWIAQTRIGAKILGDSITKDWPVFTRDLPPLPKMVECPVCSGKGCRVCDSSGITTPGYWLKWRPWQLEEMKKEVKRGDHRVNTGSDQR